MRVVIMFCFVQIVLHVKFEVYLRKLLTLFITIKQTSFREELHSFFEMEPSLNDLVKPE